MTTIGGLTVLALQVEHWEKEREAALQRGDERQAERAKSEIIAAKILLGIDLERRETDARA